MNIAEQVVHHITTQLSTHRNGIGPDTNLAMDGHLDSTAMMELILWVADQFNITLQNEDLTPENFSTPRNIDDFVQRRTMEEAQSRTAVLEHGD